MISFRKRCELEIAAHVFRPVGKLVNFSVRIFFRETELRVISSSLDIIKDLAMLCIGHTATFCICFT